LKAQTFFSSFSFDDRDKGMGPSRPFWGVEDGYVLRMCIGIVY